MATSYLNTKLKPYNPKVPGASSAEKMRIKNAQGKLAPVAKRKNPYVRPQAGGGSGPSVTTSPSSNQKAGVAAQARQQAVRPPVSTTLDVNYESDPVLARIKALGQQNVGNAQTEAAALRKQAVIDTGLTDVGREIGLDESTLAAAAANPLSVAARLQREQLLRQQQLDESLNQQNLFYSGYRGSQLADLGRSGMEEQANLVRDLREALGGIDAGVLEAQQAAALEEQQALEEAAAQAHQQAQAQEFQNALAMALNPPSENFMAAQDFAGGAYGFNPYGIPQVLTPEEELMLALGGSGSRQFQAL